MKVLVLTSGGDAPGMNRVIYALYRHFGKNLYASRYGYRGLIKNDIIRVSEIGIEKCKNLAGSIIKSARCPEFAEDKFFKKALKNAKAFDYIIVLGGNGTHKGACRLAENGVKTIFIPATIDNDVEGSDYSLGFHTAVKGACEFIFNTLPSYQSDNACCIYEVMGRYKNDIAINVASIVDADKCIICEEDINFAELTKLINSINKQERASCIVLRERIYPVQNLVEQLRLKCPKVYFKGMNVGRVQRASRPTKREIYFAKAFAKGAIKAIKQNKKCASVLIKEGKVKIIDNI